MKWPRDGSSILVPVIRRLFNFYVREWDAGEGSGALKKKKREKKDNTPDVKAPDNRLVTFFFFFFFLKSRTQTCFLFVLPNHDFLFCMF